MSSSDASQSIPYRSKKPLNSTSNSKSPNDRNLFCSPTPEKKPPELPRRSRKRNAALSIKEVRKAAESLCKSNQKQPHLVNQIDSARRQIDFWPDKSPSAKLKNDVTFTPKLPEKYEDLIEQFNGLVNSIRILRLRGSMPNFTNIFPCIARLTDRRFTYGILAQMKFILPEVIEVKKVLMFDEQTRCMKPDLHVTMNAGTIINETKLKLEGRNIDLKNIFRTRLTDFSQSHPEAPEIPAEVLPEPFNSLKQEMLQYKTKLFTSFSSSELAHNEIPEDLSSKLNKDVHSNMSNVPDTSLTKETSHEVPNQQKPVIAAHLSQSFRRLFSQKARSHGEEGTDRKSLEISILSPVNSVPKSSLNSISSSEDVSSAQSSVLVITSPSSKMSSTKDVDGSLIKDAEQSTPRKHASEDVSSAQPFVLDTATPNKNLSSMKDEDGSLSKDAEQSTPAKLASTPARIMTVTPALRTPKTHIMSPDDECANSPNKLARRPPHPRSLKFDSPAKNKIVKNKMLESVSIDNEILDLPESLIQSIREKENKAKEEQDPAIAQAKRRRRMIAFLPKLFNMIQFLFQSLSRSVITKEELIHKIISGHSDIVDRNEVEEQLTLLLELAPEWISEKLCIGGDLLIRFDKMASPESIRRRLEEASSLGLIF